MVTWPSAIITTLLSLRTHRTVVPCIGALPWLLRIPSLYSGDYFKARGHLTGSSSAGAHRKKRRLRYFDKNSNRRWRRSGRHVCRRLLQFREVVLQHFKFVLRPVQFAPDNFDLFLLCLSLFFRRRCQFSI